MVAGSFSETQYAQQQRQLLLEKHIRHTSFGLTIMNSKQVQNKEYMVLVDEAVLNEGSITAIPANPKAKVQKVASKDGEVQEDQALTASGDTEELDLETLKAIRDDNHELLADLALRSIRSAGSATLREHQQTSLIITDKETIMSDQMKILAEIRENQYRSASRGQGYRRAPRER